MNAPFRSLPQHDDSRLWSPQKMSQERRSWLGHAMRLSDGIIFIPANTQQGFFQD
jgi:hypothetical protein